MYSSSYPDVINGNLIDLGQSLSSSDSQTDDLLHLFDPLMLDEIKSEDNAHNNKSSRSSATVNRAGAGPKLSLNLNHDRFKRTRSKTDPSNASAINSHSSVPSSATIGTSFNITTTTNNSTETNSSNPRKILPEKSNFTNQSTYNLSSTLSTSSPTISFPPSSPPPLAPKLGPRNNSISSTQSSSNSFCNFRVVARKYCANPDVVIFHRKLQELRGRFKYNDSSTNSGNVTCSSLDYYAHESHSVKLEIFTPFSEDPVVLTSNINTSVEHVIFQVVCSMTEDSSAVNFYDYALKISNLNEYFVNDSLLKQYAYIYRCHMLDTVVSLVLVNINTDSNYRLYARTAEDDENFLNHSPDDLLPGSHINQFGGVNEGTVNLLLETLDKETEKFINSVNNENSNRTLNGVIQATKALCSLLGNCDTLQITQAIDNLTQTSLVYDKYQKRAAENLNEEQIGSLQNNLFCHAIDKLKQAIQEMIFLYCKAFPVNFEPKRDTSKTHPTSSATATLSSSSSTATNDSFQLDNHTIAKSPEEPPRFISTLSDTLLVYIGTVNSLSFDWQVKYREFYISCEIWFGESLLAQYRTGRIPMSKGMFHRIVFNDLLHFESLSLSSLPRESLLYINLIGDEFPSASNNGNNTEMSGNDREASKLVALTVLKLFDFEEKLTQGSVLLGMWSGEIVTKAERASFVSPCTEKGCPLVVINLPDYGYDVKFPDIDNGNADSLSTFINQDPHPARLDSQTIKTIHLILNSEPVQKLSKTDQTTLWDLRNYLHQVSYALPKVLKSAPSWRWNFLKDIYSALYSWRPLPAVDAMQLLSAPFPDRLVRSTAVKWISQSSDDEICDYLPQLIQALRFELSLDSPLIWFLFSKAYTNIRIGHNLYWLLKQNIDPTFSYHSRIYLNALLQTCGEALRNLFKNQESLQVKLSSVSERLKGSKDSHRLSSLFRDLSTVNDFIRSYPVALPLSPSMYVAAIDIDSCSYFTSNTMPLKLTFKSHLNDSSPASLIDALYKVGDDLRQDAFTMQMITIMNKLWLQEGLDLRIITYDCVATDYRRGFVEIVKNAETLRKIQTEYGITGSFRDSCISEWLQKHNPLELNYRKAVENFTYSLAGYVVVTYVLGIGDRHNDNIMITTSGHLFHIDFGKYLGDAQMLGSIKRDRTPFILTTDMAYVINGGDKPSEQFQNFVQLCCEAFNIIRRHTNLFLNLFSLMIYSGVPGLCLEAFKYIHRTLLPSLTEAEATVAFNKMIEQTLSSLSTKFNFFLHNLAQLRFTGDPRRKKNKRNKANKKALQRSKSDDFLIDYMEIVHKQRDF